MARKMRMVENIKSGDRWIETAPKDWEKNLAAYLETKNAKVVPCPCIQGHLIFKDPKSYGCKLVEG